MCVSWRKEKKGCVASALGMKCSHITCQYDGKQFNFGHTREEKSQVCQRPVLALSLCPPSSPGPASCPVLIYEFSLVESRMWISPPKWIWRVQAKEHMETERKSHQLTAKVLFIKVSASLQNWCVLFLIHEKKIRWHEVRKINTVFTIRSSFGDVVMSLCDTI